jgi:hypothetical protein
MAHADAPLEVGGRPDILPTDTVLIIRDGGVYLSTPEHDDHDPVPEDFLVALGVARAFGDEDFRTMMLMITKSASDAGHLDGIIRGARVQ